MFGLRLYTTHQFLPASALDLDRHQEALLAEILHFDRTMVGLPPMMILALGATAMAVPTGAMAPTRLDWDSAEVQLDAEPFISAHASSGDVKDQQMAAFLKVSVAQVAGLHKKLQAEPQRVVTQQLICDFDEKGVSG